MDNAHKCKINATMGGVYANKKDITIDIEVDNTLFILIFTGCHRP